MTQTAENGFINSGEYVLYGAEYFLTIFSLALIGVILIRLSKGKSEATKLKILRILAFVISSAIIGYCATEIILDKFSVAEDLPLIFCNLIGLFLPIYTYYRRQWLFNVLYFIVLAGAIQSVITPSLDYSLPYYDTIKFWVVHGGLITFIFFVIIRMKVLPTFRGILHSFLFVQGYVIFIVGINFILNANYLFLNEKPSTASILDLLGDWPNYIFIMDAILIPYFLVLYAPVWLFTKHKLRAQKWV